MRINKQLNRQQALRLRAMLETLTARTGTRATVSDLLDRGMAEVCEQLGLPPWPATRGPGRPKGTGVRRVK